MDVRLRFPELLDERDLTPYGLVKLSDGRISMSTAYRLVRQKGRVKLFQAEMLEVLCEVLKCQPGELMERDKKGRK
jgi:DNA-binding Xre family transcriptional regulator